MNNFNIETTKNHLPSKQSISPSKNLTNATTDSEMVARFIAYYEGRPQTYKSYRKEITRFFIWCKQQNLSFDAMKDEDAENYIYFCRSLSLQQNPDWVGTPCPLLLSDGSQNPAWRPFSGALTDKGIGYMSRCVSKFFTFMCDAGYLTGNPWKLVSADKKAPSPTLSSTETPIYTLGRSLDSDVRALLYDYVETLQAGTKYQRRHYTRASFILKFLLNTGLRRSEAALTTVGDLFQPRPGQWMLRVVGKGNKTRSIPIANDLMSLFRKYREAIGLRPYPTVIDMEQPLFGRIASPEIPLGDSALYKIVRQLFAGATTHYQATDPASAERFEKASTHWLRHSFAGEVAKNTPIHVLANMLGHTDINTSRRYVTTELDQMLAAAPKTLL